jgi:integrase/recombinase XerD
MDRHNSPGHSAIPFVQWPTLDQAAWAQALQPRDPFADNEVDDAAPGASELRPKTHISLVGAYGRWLGFLDARGIPLKGVVPAAAVTHEHVRSYVTFLRERGCASVTIATYLAHLYTVLRHMVPDRNLRWLLRWQAKAHRQAQPSRRKAARIVPQRELFALGRDLMQQAIDQPPITTAATCSPHDPALRFRDGLAIAVLAMCPLRLSNFLGLEIDRTLICTRGAWSILIPAAETKNRQTFEAPFPDCLVQALELYLETYRLRLIAMQGPFDPAHARRVPGKALWIARSGMPMTGGALTKALRRHTVSRFGHFVNPHLFRDCAATSLGDEDPENIRMGARLLGHDSFSTTEQNYIHTQTKHALGRHQDEIHDRRGDRRPRLRRPGGVPQ